MKESWFKDLPENVQKEWEDIANERIRLDRIGAEHSGKKIAKVTAEDAKKAGTYELRNKNASKRHAWKMNYDKDYKANYLANSSQRRADEIKRTPKGQTQADKNAIKELYKEAQRATKETGIPHHVDHIFPLRPVKFTTRDGRKVTLKQGWHEPDNLQVMNGSENMSKNNRILPEQYEAILQRLNPQDKIDFMEWYRLKGVL